MSSLLNNFSNNILLSNLINIRWIAILGQILAILTVYYFFNIKIPIVICLVIVLISIIINILSFLTKRTNNYLTDKEAFYFLLFDTSQLALLLYFTGGIYNPFSLLIIAPIIISASYLPIVFSIILSLFSIILVLLLSFFYIEINWKDDFDVPTLFTYGLILSLIVSLIFIAIYVYTFANSSRNISNALNQTRIALANQRKLSEVGSLGAAAVHELSTPLNTIFLILDDLLKDKILLKKNKQLKEEINLLKSEAERCKEILLRLSKEPQKLKDNFLSLTTLSNIVKINFDKFKHNKVNLRIEYLSRGNEPKIYFQDEIMYGIGNIIQNSIEYAKKIIITKISWNKQNITIVVVDDGPGFTKEILDKIGNPYISNNKENGMGLGIFIAKNLIENIGGNILFQNNINTDGSSVQIQINRNSLKV